MPLSPVFTNTTEFRSFLSEAQQARLSNDGNPVEPGTPNPANADVLNDHLRYAEAKVESYLAGRYGLPLPTVGEAPGDYVPDSIRDAVYVIARKRLFERKKIDSKTAVDDYVEVMEWLGLVSDGKLDPYDLADDDDGSGATFGYTAHTGTTFEEGFPS